MSKFLPLLIISASLLAVLQHSKSAPIQARLDILKIEEHQKHAIIAYGRNIELECQFDTPITRCAWSRQGSLLEITERYSYVRGNGNATADCNVYIRNFQQIDVGNWQCESMADSTHGSIKSTSVDLLPANSQNPPNPEILSHDKFEQIYNKNNRAAKRDVTANAFAYACILEKVTKVQLYWEVNGIRIIDTDSETVLLESISYTAILLRPKFKTMEGIDLTLKPGDVLQCKAKFVDVPIKESSTTLKIADDAKASTEKDSLNSISRNIIIGLGVVIAILLVLLIIFSGILICRNRAVILHIIKHGAQPNKDQRGSQGIDNPGYIKIPAMDDKPRKNVDS